MAKQVRERVKRMEVPRADRLGKKSRILNYKGPYKFTMSFVWIDHGKRPEWPNCRVNAYLVLPPKNAGDIWNRETCER